MAAGVVVDGLHELWAVTHRAERVVAGATEHVAYLPNTNAVASTVTTHATLYSGGLVAAARHVWMANVVDGGIFAPS